MGCLCVFSVSGENRAGWRHAAPEWGSGRRGLPPSRPRGPGPGAPGWAGRPAGGACGRSATPARTARSRPRRRAHSGGGGGGDGGGDGRRRSGAAAAAAAAAAGERGPDGPGGERRGGRAGPRGRAPRLGAWGRARRPGPWTPAWQGGGVGGVFGFLVARPPGSTRAEGWVWAGAAAAGPLARSAFPGLGSRREARGRPSPPFPRPAGPPPPSSPVLLFLWPKLGVGLLRCPLAQALRGDVSHIGPQRRNWGPTPLSR